MMYPRATALLAGVGNPFRSDDGVGPVVVGRLQKSLPTQVSFIEVTGEGAELLEAWKGFHSVILVDAVQSGEAPGTIHRFDAFAERLPGWFSHCSNYAFGVAEAIELARTLGDLPPRLIIYSIEGLDFSAGTDLSPEIAASVEEAAALVLHEIRQLVIAREVFSS
jgi:hydrogenase maturation protease